MELLPGVTAHTLTTDRLTTHWIESGPPDGVPVVLIHGNLSTSRFYEHIMARAPQRLRLIAPDMRGFGRSQDLPIDATRGLADWADDLAALLSALDITAPIHLLGWSAAGLAISQFAMLHGEEHPLASLTYLCPVSPYGYGGTMRDGRPCTPDHAGTGGGLANPELVQRLRDGDTSSDSPFSIRNVINGLYWAPPFRLSPEREDLMVEEILLTQIGDGTYPGDATPSDKWPGVGPGTQGVLNALSPKYGTWTAIAELKRKPPILWTYGALDVVVSEAAAIDVGTLGATGVIPGWPGPLSYPPQPMISQTRDVLNIYAASGGEVHIAMFANSGHAPHFDAEDAWCETFFDFVTKH